MSRIRSGLALLAVTSLLTACGSAASPDTSAGSSPSGAPASPSASASAATDSTPTPAEPVTASPAASATASAAAVLPGGLKVKGTGYSLQLAKGFTPAPEADQASRAESSHVRRSADGIDIFGVAVHPGALPPEGAARAVAETATKNGATGVKILPATTLGGLPAIPVVERRVMQGIPVVMREYIVFNGDTGYQIYFSSSKPADDAALMRIWGPMLETWRWDQPAS